MLPGWIAAAVLLLAGFSVMAAQALGRPRGLAEPLRRRSVDPHLWGYHLLGMGLLLELILFLLDSRRWGDLSLTARVAVAAAAGWIGISAVLVALALASTPQRRRSPLPPPRSAAHTWSLPYRAFLLGGIASAVALGVCVARTI